MELMRRDDDLPIRRMLRAARADAQQLLLTPSGTNDERDGDGDLTVLLDRMATIAALALELRQTPFAELAVGTLLDLYGWAVQ